MTRSHADRIRAFDTATVYEAHPEAKAMLPGFSVLTSDVGLAGPALTVLCAPGDNLALHHAVAVARTGDVIVAFVPESVTAMWGEVLTVAAQARGVAGLIIDGAIRDIEAVTQLEFPVFARKAAVSRATKDTPGVLQGTIPCGGQLVHSGDWVIADRSGVVVIPAHALEEAILGAAVRVAAEASMMDSLRAGRTTVQLPGLLAPVAEEGPA